MIAFVAVVEAENLFVNVARKMKRLNTNVGSAKAALQERPEILKAIRVNATANVFMSVIHVFMDEVIAHLVIAYGIVRVHGTAVLDVLE